MTGLHRIARRWGPSIAIVLVAAACSASPTPAPTATPTVVPASPTASASASGGPIASLPAGCALEATGTATAPRVTITDVAAQGYPDYDVLTFDFDRGLPQYSITHVEPPFTNDPSGRPLEVAGSYFFSLVFRGASIADEELQLVYEGPTDFGPNLVRIQRVVLAGDFEAVSSWIVGLAGPSCLAVQASGHRLVVGFVEAPG